MECPGCTDPRVLHPFLGNQVGYSCSSTNSLGDFLGVLAGQFRALLVGLPGGTIMSRNPFDDVGKTSRGPVPTFDTAATQVDKHIEETVKRALNDPPQVLPRLITGEAYDALKPRSIELIFSLAMCCVLVLNLPGSLRANTAIVFRSSSSRRTVRASHRAQTLRPTYSGGAL
jgi:hypothetical protein